MSMPASICFCTTWRTALSISAVSTFGSSGFAVFLLHQKVAQRLVARQAADMGGENAIAAENHGYFRSRHFGFHSAVSPRHVMSAQFAALERGSIAAEFGRRHNALTWVRVGNKPRPAGRKFCRDECAAPTRSRATYNFAADILERNLAAGRAGKAAYIDGRGSYTLRRTGRPGRTLRSCAARARHPPRGARPDLPPDTIDWPTAFLGAIKAGVVAVPVNTLLTEDDYRFMLEDSRARLLVRVRRALSQICRRDRREQRPRARHRLGRRRPRADRALPTCSSPRRPNRSPRRRRATTWASGSTHRARPASPKAPCTPTPI